jgi:hypothetical protein
MTLAIGKSSQFRAIYSLALRDEKTACSCLMHRRWL